MGVREYVEGLPRTSQWLVPEVEAQSSLEAAKAESVTANSDEYPLEGERNHGDGDQEDVVRARGSVVLHL